MDAAAERYWWCLNHDRVEDDDHACAPKDRLGPYPTRADAERALETVAERNRQWDAEDEAWENGPA